MPRVTMVGALLASLLAVVGGFALWMAGPLLTGEVEPWDGENQLFYVATLAALGALCGSLVPRVFFLWPIGVYAGQLIAILYRRHQTPSVGVDFLVPLGLLYLVQYTIPSLVGAGVVAAGFFLRAQRIRSKRAPNGVDGQGDGTA